MAAVLQEFGKQSFDIDARTAASLQAMCDRWIAHLLFGESSPSRSDLDDKWLDWPGVRDFVASERTLERKYVEKNINEYQDLALLILKDFSHAIEDEQVSDGEVRGHLDNLNENAKHKSGEDLKIEVFSAIKKVNQVLEQKRERQESQLATLADQVTSLETKLAAAQRSAERDGLTQLYNRATFDERLSETVEEDSPSGVLILGDIDHFKKVNDTYGHSLGDEVIQAVARSMEEVFNRPEDFVARYGGEEFAILSTAPAEETRLLANDLLQRIRNLEFEHEGEIINVTISLGYALSSRKEGGRAWVDRADKALYASKELGRDRLTLAGNLS